MNASERIAKKEVEELVFRIRSIKRGSLEQEENRKRGPKKEDTVGKIPR